MAKSRQRIKGRKESGRFVAIPHAVMVCENWHRCSGTGIKLLLALAKQFNGNNNGDLCAARSVLGSEGWTSAGVLNDGLRELEHYGLIEKTRQGGMHRASLYALTWKPIDYCGGKLDGPATKVPSGAYRVTRPKFRKSKDRSPSPESGAHRSGIRSDPTPCQVNADPDSGAKSREIGDQSLRNPDTFLESTKRQRPREGMDSPPSR